jgi:hypothetical protein
MLIFMIDDQGRIRIGTLVRAAMGWQGLSASRIEAGGRISRATVDRVKRGDRLSDTMLRALGDTLGLPRDYLLYVGTGDIQKIEASGADPDLIRWTTDLIEASHSGDDKATGNS